MEVYRGRYFDGRSAGAEEVGVELSPGALRLVDSAGALLAEWRHAELRLVDRPYPGRPVRLTSERLPASRLTVDDDAILGALRRQGASVRRRRAPVTAAQRKLLALAVLATAGAAALVVALPMLAEPLAALLPARWERQLGERLVEGMAGEGGFCAGEAGARALARLGARLSEAARPPHPIVVRVMETPQVNAFAAPGGQVVLLGGLIDKAEDGDEVAGVLAHEIGHVVHRHPAEGLIRRSGMQVILATFAGGDLAGEFGALLLELSHSRDDEAEADAAAVAMLGEAGLKADGLVRFFDRLAAREAESGLPEVVGLLSTHPSSAQRGAAVGAAAAAGGAAAFDAAEWRALRAICAG